MPETEATADATANGQSPWDAQSTAPEQDTFAQRPELFVGAALLGGVVLAQVLKRLGGGD
jgi:hypothetical protein